MKPGDVARVLAKCAAYDQRTIGDADVLAWHEILGDVELADGLIAVTRHYRDSAQRAMPADVLRLSREAKRDRERHERINIAPARMLPSRFEGQAADTARPAFERSAEVRAAARERIAEAQRKADETRRSFASAQEALDALDAALEDMRGTDA